MLNSLAFRKAQRAVERGKRMKAPTCHVRFFLRGQGFIYIRVVVNSKRATDKSIGIKTTAENFDAQTRTILNDATQTNWLRALEGHVQQAFALRLIAGESLDPNLIRDIALGLRGHSDDVPTVIEAIKLVLKRHEQRAARKDLSPLSIMRYRRYGEILEQFFTLRPGYGRNIRFDQLKPALEHHLVTDYLKAEKSFGHAYAVKVFQFFRGVIEYAIAEEWADRNPIRHVRLRKQRKQPVTLTMDDINKLKKQSFVEVHANQVRDVFLFCCYTGLAYADVVELNEHHLTTIKEIPCILKNRSKSGVQSFIPLFPEAQAILDKYRLHEGCRMKGVLLPVLSNQKMNNWLKIVGNTVGIKERLHTHLARKTFTMYSEELGFTLNDMAVMMGHTHTAMTESHYYQRRREPVISRFKSIFKNADSDEAQRQAS